MPKPRRYPLGLAWLVALAFALCGCGAGPGYVLQAARGQWQLYWERRPVDTAIVDTSLSVEHRRLLAEVAPLKDFARENGLSVDANYNHYVDLKRDYVVWFVNASHPLRFEPLVFDFPIVGSFPGLGWFSQEGAEQFQAELAAQGWDANVRGVRAFSTAGWFSDPVLSSMFTERETALSYLVNVILHESVHATVLLKDQQYYNESLASFIADKMTPQYLARRFGAASSELLAFLDGEARFEADIAALSEAYDRLERVYQSTASEAVKLVFKARMMHYLKRRFELEQTPNNATLIGARLYAVAEQEFEALYRACQGSWVRFIASAASAHPELFARPQREDFGPVVTALAAAGCRELERPPRTRYRLH